MRLLMLAWRDMKHPLKGGAEVVTDIYLKGLASRGHHVTLFSSRFEGSPEREFYNGYTIIRRGGRFGVYPAGFHYALTKHSDYDHVIDQVNTIPFFTPLAVPKDKCIGFFHQLCLDVWDYEMAKPISWLGNLSERLYLRCYSNTKCLTASRSTANDLRRYVGAKDIFMLENQIDIRVVEKIPDKEDHFVYCGRLKRSKRVHDCIKAIGLMDKARLYVIGEGDVGYKNELVRLTSRLGLDDRIIFTGRLSDQDRNRIMARSQAILVTSVREGWGLIVTEANANGTMAITYDVPGLTDANRYGLITKKNSPECLSEKMKQVIEDPKLMVKKTKESMEFARTHSDWPRNIDIIEDWLKGLQEIKI
jgi:glycosyltransferase involved in cell wall biosynthesis